MTPADPITSTSATLAEVLRRRADLIPDARAYCFLIDGEEEGPRFTYAGLDRAARCIAAALQDVAGPGDRALLLYAPGLDFIAAFFGCQYAGVVPVPAYPPRPERLAQSWEILSTLSSDCRPRVVLTGGPAAAFVSGIANHVPALADACCVVTDGLDNPGAWREPAFDPNALALVQYTSGSTADPKGVMVTHRNLMHSQGLICDATEHYRHVGVGVNWLPPYHDLGLMGGILQTVFLGATLILLAPVAVLQQPLRWLRAISQYRADTSGGPNFGYDLCVQRTTPEERAALDLRNWSVAGIGSEPVSARTIEAFTAAFAPAGFAPEAFYPCYGLAEATLLVTAVERTALPVVRHLSAAALEQGQAIPVAGGATDARALVGCGHPWGDTEVRIVDPEGQKGLPDGHIGEIWVKGQAVALGYWGRDDETERTFGARLGDGGGPYLRTGDLGFVEGGEVFVTGRIKDLLVIRGRNHYPQDIEATVQSAHLGLRRDCGAAFEVYRDGRARLVVVQEVDRRYRDLDVTRATGDVRQAVAERHELQVEDVQFLEPGTIPKTSSGKVRRHACRQGYEGGTLRRWRGRRRP